MERPILIAFGPAVLAWLLVVGQASRERWQTDWGRSCPTGITSAEE